MAKHMGIADVQIHSYGGYPKLRPFLRTFVALPRFRLVKTLAVVADANSSSADREKGIQDALSVSNLPVPPGPLGVECSGNLRVVYLIVPHNRQKGMIEDVCLESVSTDPASECVDSYFEW